MNHSTDTDSTTGPPSASLSDTLPSTPRDLQTLTPILFDSFGDPRPSPSFTSLSSYPSTTDDLIRPGNEWLKVLRREHTNAETPLLNNPQYRVTPIIIVSDIYRIWLFNWRVDSDRANKDVNQRLAKLVPKSQFDLYAVEYGTDIVSPATKEHFSADGGRGNFFLVCVPVPFVVRVSIVGSNVPDILVSINPILAVSDLKKAIEKARGYPPDRTDLVYKGIPFVNNERLYLYKLHDGDTVKMVLQRNQFVTVHFQTFWDRMYDLDIDVTSTVSEVLAMIFRQCIAGQTGNYSLDECYVSSNAITIRTADGGVLGPMDCIAQALDPNNADNYLTVIENRTSDFYVTLAIENEIGNETYQLRAIDGAKLVSVYLRLHGITNIPIDLMTLVAPGRSLNPFDNLHTQYHGTRLAFLAQDLKTVQLLHMQRIDVIMPAGNTMTVFVSNGGKVRDIKKKLQHIGYTDAMDYAISYKNGILSDEKAIDRCGFSKDSNHVFLVRAEFSVDIVAVQGEMRKVKLQDHVNLVALYDEGDDLYKPIGDNSQYIFCGNVLLQRRTAHRAKLQPGNLVFQDRSSKDLILEIVFGSDVYSSAKKSLSLHRESVVFELRRLLSDWRLSNWTLQALEQAIIWRNFPRPPNELIRNAIATEIREDMYGVDSISDPRYRWNFKNINPSNVKMESLDEVSRRTQKVRALLEINDKKTYGYINLPPLKLYSEPLTLNYDHAEGLSSLVGQRNDRINVRNTTNPLMQDRSRHPDLF